MMVLGALAVGCAGEAPGLARRGAGAAVGGAAAGFDADDAAALVTGARGVLPATAHAPSSARQNTAREKPGIRRNFAGRTGTKPDYRFRRADTARSTRRETLRERAPFRRG